MGQKGVFFFRWDRRRSLLLWGQRYFADVEDLVAQPSVALWYAVGDWRKQKIRFKWERHSQTSMRRGDARCANNSAVDSSKGGSLWEAYEENRRDVSESSSCAFAFNPAADAFVPCSDSSLQQSDDTEYVSRESEIAVDSVDSDAQEEG